MGSVEEMITFTIQEMVDFHSMGSSGCSFHHQNIVEFIVRDVRRITIPWWVKQTKGSVGLAGRQKATKNKIKILLWE